MPAFDQYLGIDYSGAETPTARLKGLRVYMADRASRQSEVLPPPSGVRMKLHVFCFDLPQSDACFIKAYPAETTEAFLDGHVSAFVFFGGVPISIFVRDSRPRQQKSVKARETHIVNGLTPDLSHSR